MDKVIQARPHRLLGHFRAEGTYWGLCFAHAREHTPYTSMHTANLHINMSTHTHAHTHARTHTHAHTRTHTKG
jgi:hypothetical protein